MRHPAPRILLVLSRVLGWRTYAETLSRVAAARHDVETDVLFVEPSPVQRLLVKHHRVAGLRRAVKRIDPIRAYRGLFGRRIREEIARRRPEIVHFGSHWPAAAALSLPAPIPFTAALDSTLPSMADALGDPGLWSASDREREGDLLRRAERLYPWSRWTAGSLVDHYGIDAARLRVIPPSIDVAGPVRPPRRDGGRLKVIFIGNDFLRKGGDRLHRWVTERLPDLCELHIVSSDPRAAVGGSNVVFHGRVPNLKLRTELLPQMDVLCHPTRSDMSAYVVAEAGAAGLPVVASAIGGIPDLVEPGRTGFLVSPDDEEGFVSALSELATSRERVERMSRASREHVEAHLDATTNYGAMLDELAALVASRR